MKETVLQYFQWYTPSDGNLWKKLKQEAPSLANIGYTTIWLPPCYKGQAGKEDVGYGVYDLYDLGEFDQKGSIQTKYGKKEELLEAIHALHDHKLQCLADIVFNQKLGADQIENCRGQAMDPADRNRPLEAVHDMQAWTLFEFKNRNNIYSDFKWHWDDFTGVDYDVLNHKNGIFLFEGKIWNTKVSKEQGDFDYIMGADVDFNSERVKEELYQWGKWFQNETGVDGFRLDCLKSIDYSFFENWLKEINKEANRDKTLVLGEYWSGDYEELLQYLKDVNYGIRLFDVPLHFHLQRASSSNGNYDIRSIFDQTISKTNPEEACVFVDNHDTQPTQALESWVMDWFKPSAYAMILLRNFTMPCVFLGDIEGISKTQNPPVKGLSEMVWIRKNLLGDDLQEYNDDDSQKLAWLVDSDHPVFVILTIGDYKEKQIQLEKWKNKQFVNVMNPSQRINCDEQGNIMFYCDGGSCGVWILEEDFNTLKQQL